MVKHKTIMKTSSKPKEDQITRLLVEVANLHDEGVNRFWREWRNFRKETPKTLFELRKQLRQVWEQEILGSQIVKILDGWVNFRHPGLNAIAYFPWKTELVPPRILPNSGNLRGYLAFAVLHHLPVLAVCGNPNCRAK